MSVLVAEGALVLIVPVSVAALSRVVVPTTVASVIASVTVAVTTVAAKVFSSSVRVFSFLMTGNLNGAVIITCLASIMADLVPDLTSRLSSAKLPLRLEAIVPVNSDCAAVQRGPVQCVHS